jgi:hypothetical protein
MIISIFSGCAKKNKIWVADFMIEITVSGKVYSCNTNQALVDGEIFFLDTNLDYIASQKNEYIKLCSSGIDGSFEKTFKYFWGKEYSCSFEEYVETREAEGINGEFEIVVKKQGFQEHRERINLHRFNEDKHMQVNLGKICLKETGTNRLDYTN